MSAGPLHDADTRLPDLISEEVSDAVSDAAGPADDAAPTAPAAPADAVKTALRLHMEGDFAGASACYEQALRAEPANADVLQLAGLSHLAAGQVDRAAERLSRCVDLEPGNPTALVNLSLALRALGRFDDALACLDRAITNAPDHFDAWMERGATQVQLERISDALASFDHALRLRPAHTGALNEHGDMLRRLGRIDEALACFDQALAIAPDDVSAWINRSNALREARRNAEALEAVERALVLDPANPAALNNRGNTFVNLRRFADAIASFEGAIERSPTFVPAWVNLANALSATGRLDEAHAAFEHALSIAPHSPAAQWNAALFDLRTERYDPGWTRHEARWSMPGFAARRYTQIPMWLGKEDLRGKRILLWQEQGHGDTIQFCRYAIMVAALGATVVLEVHPPLKALIAQSFKGIAHVVAAGEPVPACDYATPLMSLPLAFSTQAQAIPFAPSYLKPDAARVAQWRERLGPSNGRLRIGIACSGNPKHRGNHDRSLDLGVLLAIANYGEIFVIQKDVRQLDQATLAAHPEVRCIGPELGDFDDTAALVANLDLVISVDTSLAHLTGALGKRLWVLLASHADWRWLLGRDDSPWYPSARLFRQDEAGNWDHVVAQVCEALAREIREVL